MAETVKDCHYPWTWMMVTADGAVKPCCFAPGQLGNLHDSSVEEIWNGPVVVELRGFIKADRIHPTCANAPCKFVQNSQARNPDAPTDGSLVAVPTPVDSQ